MNIDAQIDTLSRVLVMVLGISVLVVSAALIYIISLCMQLHRQMRQLYRRPQVERNGQGKRLKERLVLLLIFAASLSPGLAHPSSRRSKADADWLAVRHKEWYGREKKHWHYVLNAKPKHDDKAERAKQMWYAPK
jgi:hypothetical protein